MPCFVFGTRCQNSGFCRRMMFFAIFLKMWQGEAPLPLVMPLVLSHRARAGPAAPGSASAAACGCILTRHQTRRCQTCSTSLWTRGHGALFVMTHGATWHLHEHRRRSTHSLSTERAHRSWTLRLGNRLPACGTILAAGKNALRLRDPPQLHCWQIAWQALSSQLRLLATECRSVGRCRSVGWCRVGDSVKQ